MPDVVCVAPSMGTMTQTMLEKEGVRVPERDDGEEIFPDSVHLVFEYKPGIIPLIEGAMARDNRFIASPKKKGENTILQKRTLDRILPAISPCTRAFLSGYQYLTGEDEFIRAAGQIRAFKENNPDLRVHVECVSVTDTGVLLGIVQHILPAADSAGMNESELVHLLNVASSVSRKPVETEKRSPVGLVQGLLELATKTGLARLHLHTFGYYILVMKKDRGVPEDSRTALLYAAKVVAAAAGGTGSRISPAGIAAIDQMEGMFGTQQSPGVFLHENYFVILIPTLIAESIQKTVGLGDIISSTALVADRF
jgi:ADP-dependent phosphofructokinase/glucokinase